MAIADQELRVAHEPDWIRIRLALAVRDADAGRLDGVVGHYRALREALDVDADLPVEAGLRTMADVLGRTGRRDLAKQADGLADAFVGALLSSGTRSKPTPARPALEMAPAPA